MDRKLSVKERQFLVMLATQGYNNITPLPDNRWAATFSFIYTDAIIIGPMMNDGGYTDRYCYHRGEAKKALEAWAAKNFEGEPQGWHRDPRTGRRRQNGDPMLEEIRF